ncbi:protein FAR-RED IMPAIRED RESPONSE 1-like [Daucus carota subsp. sativus]|uniref:protein FAR-RED IMPAIRED RESPONSE 1-like n=1 Tax=Daucus carota subsp. sativus TaxID=79200 RepID=UPI0030835C9E
MVNIEEIPDVHRHVESSESDDFVVGSDNENSEFEMSAEQVSENNKADPTCQVGADSTKYWTPKCDETKKPKLNQHFSTLDEAFDFYREYGKECGFDVISSTKKSDRWGNLYAKYYQCSRGNKPDTKKFRDSAEHVLQGPCKRTTSKRCECRARIIMKRAGLRGFVLMGFIEEHNHPLATGKEKMFLRCNRNLSTPYQNFILDCSRANIGPTRAHSLLKEMTGSYDEIGATVDDFKNFSRDVKVRIGPRDCDKLLSKFKLERIKSKNRFYYEYKVDTEGHLTGLFWTDVVGQANYDVFGDIVSFDPTFRTNKYHMVFVPFTGVNNHWKNVTFAATLLAKEDYKNFKWLVTTFQKAMGRAPKTVITDQCKAIKKALDKCWRSSTHRLCMWHIMNKLPMKVGPKLASDKKFVGRLKGVVYADHLAPTEFETEWKEVIEEFKLEDNTWLSEMFAIRDQWIPAYFSGIEMAGLLRTTSRSESSNFFFQHYHESGDTLVEFYSSFESAMDKQRLINDTDDRRSQEIPLSDSPMQIEIDASKIYTLEIYYLVREEIRSGCCHCIVEDRTKELDFSAFKIKDMLLNDKIFEVMVIHSDKHVTCSCNFYFRKGYLCRHAFAALHHCGVKEIPREFVKPRWTKDALKNFSFLGSSDVNDQSNKDDRTKLKRTRAWFDFNNCLNLAGDDEGKLDSVLQALESVNSSLSEGLGSSDSAGKAHRVDKFYGPVSDKEISVQNPHVSRNKGCGSRLKSSREIAAQDRKKRKCGNCNKLVRHNVRTCPEPIKNGSV